MNPRESARALALSTIAFAISFAVWGMIAPLAKTFQTSFRLTEQQAWLLIAAPVLLGAILRLPVGMLTDRFGGRLVMGGLLVVIAAPAYLLSMATDYNSLITGGLFLGIAGASFSAGIAFTSRWFPPEKQGFALGIFGSGNIGQSLALFGVPLLSAMWGWQITFRIFAAAALAWGIVFLLFGKDAPIRSKPKPFRDMILVLREKPLAWVLALFYFVTFGGFVALSIGLPKLLQEIFHLTPEDAGLRVAGFVVLATAMRPVGGYLSDKIGGARLLSYVFGGTGLLCLGMALEHIVPFTIGALGVAACVGLGNGAVFKLVPQHFAADTGTVTGLVGAMGGLGGFFPPLALGVIKTGTGSYALGFFLLALFCLACQAFNYYVFLRPARFPLRAQSVS